MLQIRWCNISVSFMHTSLLASVGILYSLRKWWVCWNPGTTRSHSFSSFWLSTKQFIFDVLFLFEPAFFLATCIWWHTQFAERILRLTAFCRIYFGVLRGWSPIRKFFHAAFLGFSECPLVWKPLFYTLLILCPCFSGFPSLSLFIFWGGHFFSSGCCRPSLLTASPMLGFRCHLIT